MKILMAAGVVAACAAAGFGWAKLAGCPDGGCPLTATPWRGAFFGGLMGLFVVFSMWSRGSSSPSAPVPGDDAILHVTTQAEFDALMTKAGDKMVVVDFYADWCGPCRRLAPELAAFADWHRASVMVVKVNVDQTGELAGRYEVSSIPALLLFHEGKLVRRTLGGMSANQLNSWACGQK
jgi:thioredoxin